MLRREHLKNVSRGIKTPLTLWKSETKQSAASLIAPKQPRRATGFGRMIAYLQGLYAEPLTFTSARWKGQTRTYALELRNPIPFEDGFPFVSRAPRN